MSCFHCDRPAAVRCAVKCGYIACDQCSRSQEHMQCGLQPWTAEKVIKFYESGEMIGRGGFGRVFGNDAIDSNVAIKFSKNAFSCAAFSSEYKLAIGMVRAQKEANFADENYEIIRVYADLSAVVLPDSKSDSYCAFVMQRVHRPMMNFGSNNQLSYQVYLGTDDSTIVSNRGNYLGKRELINFLGPEHVKRLAYSAGRFMAFLHYGAAVDAGDMEYIIGHTSADPSKLKIYAIDFDRVKKITNFNSPGTIGELEWSLSAEPYFPLVSDSMLYPLFKNGYLEVASQFGYVVVATLVLERYEESG
jgi:hypothetical protein